MSTTLSKPVTERQNEVLDFVRQFMADHGYCCGYQDIADHLGITQMAARGHVVLLERKGKIAREEGVARSIRVI